MRRILWFGIALGAILRAAAPTGSATQLAQTVRETGLDPTECYRVRDLSLYKEDIKLYFNDGYLMFSKPVNGERLSAIFSADVESGDGEVILFPPYRGERQSLARFTQSPNLDEHFKGAVLVFSDDTVNVLYQRIVGEGAGKKAPEMGPVLLDQWNSVDRNIIETFDIRLVIDLLQPNRESAEERNRSGFLFVAFAGTKLGNFDILHDPRLEQQTLAGQIADHNGVSRYDIWTNFTSRSLRTGARKAQGEEFSTPRFHIDSTVSTDLKLKATTQATVRIASKPLRVLPFEVSRAMSIKSVRVDGKPAEVLSRETTRGRGLRADLNDSFAVVSEETLAPNTEHLVEFEHEGAVISSAGRGVYFVQARSNWYPQGGFSFSTYDLTFRYPRSMNLVAPGDLKDESVDGDLKISHFVTPVAIRVAGFNLGEYEKVSESGPGYRIDVYGNRHLEYALVPKPRETLVLPSPLGNFGRGRAAGNNAATTVPQTVTPPDPLGRLRAVADDVAACFQYFSSIFGPPAMNSLTVAPVPATFGQGFPGFVYLSTIAYIEATERPSQVRTTRDQVFFSDLIQTHEVAHQWWGNVVIPAGYQDEWILEGLANYSALIWVEKKKGPKALEQVMNQYRDDLLSKDDSGRTLESAGPITWGYRIETSTSANAWRAITYEKGAWIFHMIRKRLGDENFFKMLAELRRRYEFKPCSTDDLRALIKEFLPPRVSKYSVDVFFDNWVYSTGVPALKMSYTVKGAAPLWKLTGTIEQTSVEKDFAAQVPVELQYAKGPLETVWVETSDETATFSANLKQLPLKVSLGPVLAGRK
jgi:Peptidase family M1 domain